MKRGVGIVSPTSRRKPRGAVSVLLLFYEHKLVRRSSRIIPRGVFVESPEELEIMEIRIEIPRTGPVHDRDAAIRCARKSPRGKWK